MYFISRHTIILFFCLLLQYFLQNKITASRIDGDFISDGEFSKFDERKDNFEKYSETSENMRTGPKNTSSIESILDELDSMLDNTQNESTESKIRTSKNFNDVNNVHLKNIDPSDFKDQSTLNAMTNLRGFIIPSNQINENLKLTEFTLCRLLKIYIKKCLGLDASISYAERRFLNPNLLTRNDLLECVRQPSLFLVLLHKNAGEMLRNCDGLSRQVEKPWIKRQSDVKTVDKIKKLPFHAWGGKRTNPIGTEKIQASRIPFNAWGGKRKFENNDVYSDFEDNDDFKRTNKVKFHSWGGK